MKVTDRVLDVQENLQGKKIEMTFDQHSMKFLQKIMIDLYKDPELAVIREYSTNAFDAHVEAGLERPIEVTTPSALSPYFKVRDYGAGLSEEDIENIYSKYGASTKRESDDVVGMLGLGCKSALTYTDQFTLTSTKDGVCIQVSITREADGGGSMNVVDQFETDGPSGVEIIVPAKRFNDFDSKAADFFRFWTPGTVLVNGKQPRPVQGLRVSDSILLTTEVSKSVVVMGNVPYPMPSEMGWDRHKTVAYVPIGMVHFTPSREDLQMDSHTKDGLEKIKVWIEKEKEAALQRLVNEAPDRFEAVKVAQEAYDAGLKGTATWRGEEVPESIMCGKKDDDSKFVIVDSLKGWRRKGWSTTKSVIRASLIHDIWVVGYDSDQFSPFKREKMEQWMDEKSITASKNMTVIFCEKLPRTKWINKKNVYKWDEIKAQKIVRAKKPRQDGRPTGSYRAWVGGSYKDIQAADIDTTKPIFWHKRYEDGALLVRAMHPEATVIELGLNRIAKFQRDFPTAQNARDYSVKKAETWWKSVNTTDKLALKAQSVQSRTDLSSLDANKVDDPKLKEGIALVTRDVAEVRDTFNRFNKVVYPRLTLDEIKWENPIVKYPLLTTVLRYDIIRGKTEEHVYLYINAVHAADKEN